MKPFLIGATVGVAATLLVQQLLPSGDTPAAPTTTVAVPMGAVASPPALASNPSASATPVEAPKPVAIAKPPPAGAAPGAAPPLPQLQLQLSDEHASMLNPPAVPPPQQLTLQELYARFVTEPQDPNWSFITEQSLREYLGRQNQQGEFDLRNVECRRTACVITAFGNQPASTKRWNSVVSGMGTQPEGSGFGGTTTQSMDVNGRATIVTILTRKTP